MPCHYSASDKCHGGAQTAFDMRTARGGVFRKSGSYSAGGHLRYHDITWPGDGALCHALFGFPALSVLAL